MTTIAPREYLSRFALANPLYAEALLYAYVADVSTGAATTTLATLYRATTGTEEEANPFRLDGDGKLARPVYIDGPVVVRAHPPGSTAVHDTGVLGLVSRFREEWEAGAIYQVGDIARDGAAGLNTNYLYMCAEAHTAVAWEDDLAAAKWVVFFTAGEGIAPYGALLVSENLTDVEDPAAARAALDVPSQDDLDAVSEIANDAYDNIITAAEVNDDGNLILTLGSGALLNAGAVVGPTGPVTVVGTALGTWDADANSPTLTDGSGTVGDAYLVAVEGTTTLDGVSSWSFGDTVFRGASAWERIPAASTSGVFTEVNLPTSTLLEDDSSYAFAITDAYQNVALAITEDGVVKAANATLTEATIANDLLIEDDDGVTDALSIADPDGNIAFAIKADGRVAVPGVIFSSAPAGYALIIADEWGDMAGYITDDGTAAGILGGSGGGSGNTGYSADEQARRGARALALSAAVISQTNTTAARPVWKYNHVIAYGQSLSSGWEGWPSLSKTQPYDSLMIGDSDHPASETSAAWVQIGSAAFAPLVATVESGGALASDGTVAAYSPGNSARGESPVVGAVNFWRKQQLQHRGLASDSTRLLVASSCGVGGKTIAQLSSGASPNLFNRMIDCAELGKSIADGASATYGIPAVLFLQGENDALDAGTSVATYKTALATLQQNFYDEIAVAVAGQTPPPAWFTYQTSQAYVRDSNNLAVSQAQLEAAQEFDDWYMVGPSYPVTDKGSFHLDPNGYRWLGMQFGKVMHQVLDLGRGWLPVHPIRVTYRGTQVLAEFHVPHPPLQFQPCYVSTTATTYAAKGFKVTDDSGALTISSVEIVSDVCVLITLSTTPGTNPYLWYGGQSPSAGNGNLCDSDPTTASDLYEYTAGTGQYAGAEIAALEDEPYPLWNWCALFRLPITYDPST